MNKSTRHLPTTRRVLFDAAGLVVAAVWLAAFFYILDALL